MSYEKVVDKRGNEIDPNGVQAEILREGVCRACIEHFKILFVEITDEFIIDNYCEKCIENGG